MWNHFPVRSSTTLSIPYVFFLSVFFFFVFFLFSATRENDIRSYLEKKLGQIREEFQPCTVCIIERKKRIQKKVHKALSLYLLCHSSSLDDDALTNNELFSTCERRIVFFFLTKKIPRFKKKRRFLYGAKNRIPKRKEERELRLYGSLWST